MKVCKYCETENNDENLACGKCGANEFSSKCDNCNTIFDSAFCPNCGKRAGEKSKICPNCGTKSFELFCSKCGTDLIHNCQKNADAELGNEIDNTIGKGIPTKVPPEVIIQNYNSVMKSRNRVGVFKIFLLCITPFLLLAILVSCIIAATNSGDAQLKKEATVTKAEEDIYPNTAKDKYANVDGMDIVKKEGHPLFYGDFNEAKKFWRDYTKVRVVNAKEHSFSDMDALLCITTSDDKNNGIITDICFNFSDVKDRDKLKLDDFLKVICKYIPYDIIDKYYSYSTSYKETEVDKKQDFVAYRYIMTLNNNGKKLKNPNYDEVFAFDIICREGDDWIAQINPFAAIGNHQKLKTEEYKVEKWKVDINKYRPKTNTAKTNKASTAKAATDKTKQNKTVTNRPNQSKASQAETNQK